MITADLPAWFFRGVIGRRRIAKKHVARYVRTLKRDRKRNRGRCDACVLRVTQREWMARFVGKTLCPLETP